MLLYSGSLNLTESITIFCFSRQSTWLHSGCKFWPAFCELCFQCQFCFQSLCSTIWICLMCVQLRGQSLTFTLFYLFVQFSKSLVWCLGSHPWMYRFGMIPGIHKQLYGVTCTSFSFSVNSPAFSQFPRAPLFSPLAKHNHNAPRAH